MERVSSRRTRSPLSVAYTPDSDAALVVPGDGLHTPTIKPHSLKKIRAHNRFARMFATSMRAKWELAYIGLYAGAGHARLHGTDTTVQTSALSVLRQPHPFKHYIFVENDADCLGALSQRWRAVAPTANVHIIPKNVNESIPDVRAKLPSSTGLLSFCFVDPFNTNVKFETIRALTDLRIDFLILLMLGNDARRNFANYFWDPTSNRIAEFIDRPNWREEFQADGKPVRYVLNAFDEGMQRAGYPSARQNLHRICAEGTSVLQYMLAFYSKNPVGTKLWMECMKSLAHLETQGILDLN
jgi:three-Cys-motif partner protein